MAFHHKGSTCFELPLDEGNSAYLRYHVEGSGVWDCYDTEVPSSHRGQGLGGVLAKAVFEYARENGIKLRLTCTYLAHFIEKHHEYSDVVVSTA